jgi:Na+-transporting NADH:ubiquinone oxidoreductase subunit C
MREIVQCDEKKSDSDCAGSYNFVSESKLPEKNVAISKAEDFGDIKVRARYMPVYLVKANGQVSEVVLPFYGQGLWSTMYGYLAVDADGSTIKGVKYYSQGETAGLGAEVTNPAYTGKWIAKKLYENGEYKFKVTKGADKTSPYQVDAISGATLTSDGVNNSVKYWFEKVYVDYLRGLNHK